MKQLSLILWVLVSGLVAPQPNDTASLGRFTDAVLELQNGELMRHGTLAVCVQSVSSGQIVAALNQELSLPSASTLKLVTTATALSVLGGDYRYQTFLEYDGQLVGDTLRGNLYLRGSGDPTLGSDRFKGYPDAPALLSRWTAAVRRAGIRYVQGAVVADAGYFDEQGLADSWVWGDVGNYYGAAVRGLNFNENQYRVNFRPGAAPGDSARVTGTSPELPYLSLTNRVSTGEAGSGDQVIIYGSPLGTSVLLTGTVPQGVATFSVKGALPDAAYYAAYALREQLRTEAIGVAGEPVVQQGTSGAPRKVLDTYTSPTLREICQQTNWWSINLYADALLKTVGKRLAGRTDFEGATQAVARYWQSRGVDTRGFYIKDGSGLSPTGSLTARNLTDILTVAARDKNFLDFSRSIAVMGQSGTLRNMGKGTRAAGNVRAKSGSIEGTRAYAGYVTTRSGEELSFTLMAHKYPPGQSRELGQELARLLVLLGDI
jgi:serine-type D-Ala-D-Ala carboxypeptidase/endopeptidase (penicillin-binding protein 4)